MGLAKVFYIDGDERDYIITYDKKNSVFYACNYFGGHKLYIYSSVEERPESDGERYVRLIREKEENERRLAKQERERKERQRIELERKEYERIALKFKERKRFEERIASRISKDNKKATGGIFNSDEPPKSFLCPITVSSFRRNATFSGSTWIPNSRLD